MATKSDTHLNAQSSVRQAEDDLEPFIVACVSTRMPMLFTDASDPNAPISFANDSMLALTGHLLAEILGKSFFALIAEDNEAKMITGIKRRFEKKTGATYEVKCCRKDGSEFWATVFLNPVFNREGKTVHHFASFIDLTQHKAEQEHSKMLIDELNHRVKNTLSTVQSIIRQALRSDADPNEIKEMLRTRISALSRSHDLLTREKWKNADIWDVVNEAMEPFRMINHGQDRITIAGPNIRFPPKVAVALAIVLNELATNAMKYGSLSSLEGTVRISWTMDETTDGPQVNFHWREFGGPQVKIPKSYGFGIRVIERGLAHEINATTKVNFQPDGLVCDIRFPYLKNYEK